MSNNRRLGRGLEALLGRSLEDPSAMQDSPESEVVLTTPSENPETNEAMDRDFNGQLWLDVVSIDTNPNQPRKSFDEVEIADLADSIRAHGVIQPLVVRQVGERFELIAGERRLRAAHTAGWERVPVLVRDVSDQKMAEVAIVENIQRKDLNPLEKAACFQKYLQDYNCTQEELASRIHIDRSTIANLIRLLELPEPVKQLVVAGHITQGHARALLPLGDEQQQIDFANRIKTESLSVRATEQAVQDQLHAGDEDLLSMPGDSSQDQPTPARATRSEQLAYLEQELKTALGTKVTLNQNAKGKGKVTIHFADSEEFERLRSILTASQQAAPLPAAA